MSRFFQTYCIECALIAGIMLPSSEASSATTYTSVKDGDWFSTQTWSPSGSYPGASDTAVIRHGLGFASGPDWTVARLVVEPAGSFYMSSGTLTLPYGSSTTTNYLSGGVAGGTLLNQANLVIDCPQDKIFVCTLVNQRTTLFNTSAQIGFATLINSNRLDLLGTGNLNVPNGAVFENATNGAFWIRADVDLVASGYLSGEAPRFNNQGMVLKYSNGESEIAVPLFNRGEAPGVGGRVDVMGGTLRITGDCTSTNGQFNARIGKILQLPGTHNWSGVVSGGSEVAGRVEFSGALYSKPWSALRFGEAAGFEGGLHWTGGSLYGRITNAPLSRITLEGAAPKTLGDRYDLFGFLINEGTIDLTDSGNFVLSYYTRFHNHGALNIQSGADIAVGGPLGGSPELANFGSILKTATGATAIGDIVFTNMGTLRIEAGSLDFYWDLDQISGVTELAGGSLSTDRDFRIFGGTLRGDGTVDARAVINSGGTVDPGLATGQLSIEGAYLQDSGGALNIEIKGTPASLDYDRLTITGTATLGGALAVVVDPAYTPVPGEVFPIVTAPAITGAFATSQGLELGGGYQLEVVYSPTQVSLVVTNTVTAPTISAPTLTGPFLQFNIPTEPGHDYIVEASTNLNPPRVWSTLLSLPGDGTEKPAILSTSEFPQRFFRIRVD